MQNFQDTFETPKRSFISASSVYMTVPLNVSKGKYYSQIAAKLCSIDKSSKTY